MNVDLVDYRQSLVFYNLHRGNKRGSSMTYAKEKREFNTECIKWDESQHGTLQQIFRSFK